MRTQFGWSIVTPEGQVQSSQVVGLDARLVESGGELKLEIRTTGEKGSWYWLLTVAPLQDKLQLLRGGFARDGHIGQYFHLAGPAGQIATTKELRDEEGGT